MMVCYQHSFPISNRETTVCTPYAPKEKGNAANVAFGNQIDHWSGLSLGFLRCRASSSACAISTIARMSVPALSPISSILASVSSALFSSICKLSGPVAVACRRATSPRIAVTINPALLSSGLFNASMLSITSCGMRIDICFDLSLTVFLTMSVCLMIWCDSVYTKNESQKGLTCDSLETNLNHTSLLWCDSQRQRPGVLGTTTEASNHNVTEAYIMACSHDTQTRPEKKYRWRFLALKRSDLGAKPCCLSVNASTEREARRILAPHFILSLAARLPVHGGCDNPTPSKHGHITIVQEVAYV